jgi:pyridoxine 4-dehydrogenase
MMNLVSGRIGRYEVRRVGFGAMQLPGRGVFGPPADREAALRVLRRVIELGVNHIDTAQYYGPDVSNELIHAALHPYPDDLVLVSKVGAKRDDKGAWHPANSPRELREGVEANLRSLEVEQIGIVNLRVGDTGEPDKLFDEQVGAMAEMRDAGLVGGIGVSNVSIEQLRRATELTQIACVQNAFSVVDRTSTPVLEACEEQGIAFVPFFPLGSAFPGMKRVEDDSVVVEIANRLGATAAQVALAWLLALSPSILLIPGTSSIVHLEENMASAGIALDDETLELLSGN